MVSMFRSRMSAVTLVLLVAVALGVSACADPVGYAYPSVYYDDAPDWGWWGHGGGGHWDHHGAWGHGFAHGHSGFGAHGGFAGGGFHGGGAGHGGGGGHGR
jgi:hypothetical protein